MLYFVGFRFDAEAGKLWTGAQELPLRPKTAAVLNCLLSRPGDVVSKESLLSDVWPDGFVGDAVLHVCINELRSVLDDDLREPRFIATVSRRGYRFVAPVSTAAPAPDPGPMAPFVGREQELDLLRNSWLLARGGDRQVVFIAAQAGVGKSALTEVFADEIRSAGGALIGFGQCAEQLGEGESYLSVLDALLKLGRGPDGPRVLSVLRSVAPTWLLQLPGLLDAEDRAQLAGETFGATSARMLREMANALEELTVRKPMLLVLEDLHHGDRSTTELLGFVARRREPARLMILGTHRPAEAAAADHAIRQVIRDLDPRGLCRYIPLELLSRTAIARYLDVRLAPGRPSAELITDVHQRTDGNSLFVTKLVDHLVATELLDDVGGEVRSRAPLTELGIPDSVRQYVERQLDELTVQDRAVLEVGATIGEEFASAAVFAGARRERPDLTASTVDDQCVRLARGAAVLTEGQLVTWPDRTVTTNYRFRHGLYQEVLYSGLAPGRRAAIHRHVGERLAAAYGDRTGEVAAELAMHFERGQDHEQAVRFLAAAASTELQRGSSPEALAYTERALHLLQLTPALADSAAEMRIRRTRLVTIGWLRGFGDPDVDDEYRRLRDICARTDDATALDSVLFWIWNFALNQRSVEEAAQFTDKFAELAQLHPTPARTVEEHYAAGVSDYAAGRPTAALPHLEPGLAAYEQAGHQHFALNYGQDLGIGQHRWGAFVLWLLGYSDQARDHTRRARRLADELGYPREIARVESFAAAIDVLCGDIDGVRRHSANLLEITEAHEAAMLTSFSASAGRVYHGWALAQLGDHEDGIRHIRDGMGYGEPDRHGRWPISDSLVAANLHFSTWLLADALSLSNDADAMAMARRALSIAQRGGHHWYEAEELRLVGDVLLRSGSPAEAERTYLESYAIATRQQAKALELRAATSLARLWAARGDADRAVDLLAPLHASFTEGHDTRDLRAAASVLDDLDA